MNLRAHWILSVATATVLGAGAAQAADADLDPSFGGTGAITLQADLPAGDAVARGFALLRDAQGRTLALATVVDPFSGSASNALDLLIYRLNANGSLDATYNFGQGYLLQNIDWLELSAVTLDSQGRIVIAGSKLSEPPNPVGAMLALRLTPAGERDNSFGTDGIVGASFGNLGDRGVAIAVGANDDVYLGGSIAGSNPNWVAFKFAAANGAAVGSWGSGGLGLQTIDFQQGSSLDALVAISALADGRLVLLGQACASAANCRPAAARLAANGQLDATFCASAACVASSPSGIQSGRRIVRDLVISGFSVASGEITRGLVTDGGSLLLGGRVVATGTGANDRALVLRMSGNGELDAAFGAVGNPGLQTVSVADAPLATRALALDSAGRVLVAGTATRAGLRRIYVARLLANGTLDGTFAGGAALAEYFAVPASDDRSVAALLPVSGRITAIGDYAGPLNRDAFVFRLSATLFEDGFE